VSGERQYLDRPAVVGGVAGNGVAGNDVELAQDEWAAVAPRMITRDQWRQFEGYMQEIFGAMGMKISCI
jgi:GTP cyclohydrolase I